MANAIPFPPYKPSSRSFNPGRYPSSTFESLDGTKTHIRFSNRRVNATLTLTFTGVTDSQVGVILKNYDDVNSVWDYVAFGSDNGTAGIIDPDSGNFLTKEIQGSSNTGITEKGLKWRYSSPPTVTSVFPGKSNVNCSFVACLDS